MADSAWDASLAAAVPATTDPRRHTAVVRVTHWVTTLCFFALLVSGPQFALCQCTPELSDAIGMQRHSKRPQKVQKILLVFIRKPIEPLDHFVGFRHRLRAFPAAMLLNRHHEVLGPTIVQEK